MDFMHNVCKELIIGETSQISHYLPDSITRVSARNIPEYVFQTSWDRIYVCFAEQRTIHSHDKAYKLKFFQTNVDLTLSIIEKIKSKEIVYFSTVELWGNCTGPISLKTPFDFEENYYTTSKYEATKRLMNMEHVMIAFPFNFNSKHRSTEFLMGKVFRSLMHKEKISVGCLNWNRDILHAKWVANQAQNLKSSAIIGSGTYFNVKSYVKDLYEIFGMNFNEFVTELNESSRKKNLTYLSSDKILYSYEQLLEDTVADLHWCAS